MNITFVHRGRENLGIEYLSSILKASGHRVKMVFDYGLFSSTDNVLYSSRIEKLLSGRNNIVKRIVDTGPDIAAFSVYSNNYGWALDIASALKASPGITTVFGGIHPTLIPEKVIAEPSVDYVVEGDGDTALLDLVSSADPSSADIAGLWYKKKGLPVSPSRPSATEELPENTLPDKAIFEPYIDMKEDYLVMTGKGCVCSCSFCCEEYINRRRSRSHRRRSPESVINELSVMKRKYSFRKVRFIDSILFSDKEYFKALMKGYAEKINVPYRCFGHTAFMDGEIAETLVSSGCYCVEFGVQTMSSRLRNGVLKLGSTKDQVIRALAVCATAGLPYDIDHMFDVPGETLEDHLLSLGFYAGLKGLNRIKCHNLTLYPRLAVTEEVLNGQEDPSVLGEKIDRGIVGNFINLDTVSGDISEKELKGIKTLMKIFPLLPQSLRLAVSAGNMLGYFSVIPGPIVMFLQLIIALRNKDYRFAYYVKSYPVWLCRALLMRAGLYPGKKA